MARTKTEQGRGSRETGKRNRSAELPRMKLGQTIVAERERVQSESERMQMRKVQRRKRWTAVLAGVLMVAILGVLLLMGVRQLMTPPAEEAVETEYKSEAKRS